MPKKSNKTSHVLNLLTNRVGDFEHPESADEGSFDSSSEGYEADSKAASLPQESSLESLSGLIQTELEKDGQPMDDFFDDADDFFAEPFAAAPDSSDDFFTTPLDEAVSMTPRTETEDFFSSSVPTIEEVLSGTELADIFASEVPSSQIEEVPADSDTIQVVNQEEAHATDFFTQPDTPNFFTPPPDNRADSPVLSHTDAFTKQNEAIGSYIFVNVLEDLVNAESLELMKKMGVCTCDKCRCDVIAIALNKLPPRYVVTRQGYLLSKLKACEMQYKTDVVSAVIQACIMVKASPQHE